MRRFVNDEVLQSTWSLSRAQAVDAAYHPLPPPAAITPRMICAAPANMTANNGVVADTCSGDSGGDLRRSIDAMTACGILNDMRAGCSRHDWQTHTAESWAWPELPWPSGVQPVRAHCSRESWCLARPVSSTCRQMSVAAGPLLLPGTGAATDVVYGFTSWGLIRPGAAGECGAAGDLDFFVNVAALAEFIQPFRMLPAPTGAVVMGRRMLRAA